MLYSFVYRRITINRVSKYVMVPTPCKISKEEWNEKHNGSNYIKNTNIFAFEINEKIREYTNKVNDLIKRFYIHNKTLTFEDIFKQLKVKNKDVTFNNFANEYIKNPKEKFEQSTITKYKSFLKHLNAFNC